MSEFHWGKQSTALLSHVHADLQRLFAVVIERTDQDLTILPSTIRTVAEQAEYIRVGTSKTWNSRHLHGLAVDVAPYPIDWHDQPRWQRMCSVIESVARELGIPIELGRDFLTLVDMPHVQLPKAKYPDLPAVLSQVALYREGH